jgi:hypothetical protein
MPWSVQASTAVNVPDVISLAGFQVITIGRFWVIAEAQPTENLCPGCGKKIRSESKTCVQCGVPTSTKNMLSAARIGRLTANGPEAQAKRSTKARTNALAQHSWKESDQPAWLAPKLFAEKIQPLLSSVSMSAIRSALGVSKWYASKIRQGYRPHPRHWQALAALAGVKADQDLTR